MRVAFGAGVDGSARVGISANGRFDFGLGSRAGQSTSTMGADLRQAQVRGQRLLRAHVPPSSLTPRQVLLKLPNLRLVISRNIDGMVLGMILGRIFNWIDV